MMSVSAALALKFLLATFAVTGIWRIPGKSVYIENNPLPIYVTNSRAARSASLLYGIPEKKLPVERPGERSGESEEDR
jgi:hypothetical protein